MDIEKKLIAADNDRLRMLMDGYISRIGTLQKIGLVSLFLNMIMVVVIVFLINDF
jgi:hypothetical protein